jgi:glucose-6-phosphate isomerase
MSYRWDRYQRYCLIMRGLGVCLDVSRVQFPEHYIDSMRPAAASATDAMAALEAGAIANADERRMVGHYWLRAPELAPSAELRAEIRKASVSIPVFADKVRHGMVHGAAGPFTHAIHVGIGGSALGPQLLGESQENGDGAITLDFLDNCDPDGVSRLIRRLGQDLGRTLVSVVSKSGSTPTPWRVMAELVDVYASRGLTFAQHAVATTVAGSGLDLRASRERWLARFPLWEWVGGRTSVTSAVGLLPAALQGIDTAAVIRGAAKMDELTREREPRRNPATMLALMWHWLGSGRGSKNMIVLPYRDRLAIFPRYVQQLVMESIGKRLDRAGTVVQQGLSVYGHKGVTDQHAYIQQLREGRDDSFVTFIAVDSNRGDNDRPTTSPSLGDHLFGNLEGMRDALSAAHRDSITITLPDAGPESLGALIALYERAIGLYAELIDVNAYHQPSVDKDIAAPVLRLQAEVIEYLRRAPGPSNAEEIAVAIGQGERAEIVYKVLRRQALLPGTSVRTQRSGERFGDRFYWLHASEAAETAARVPTGRDRSAAVPCDY